MRNFIHDTTYIAIDSLATSIESGNTPKDVCDMSVLQLSGSALSSEKLYSARFQEPLLDHLTVADIADAQGEWAVLAGTSIENRNHFLYFGDSSGFAPLFYSIIPERAIVISDSFSGVVQGLRRLNGHVTLNIDNYITVVSGKTPTFQTLVSTDTMANEIHLLDRSEALYVGPEAAVLIDRNSLSDAAKITDYNVALNLGVEAASDSIASIRNSSNSHIPIITLTGGVDSRLVFAFLTATGMEQDFLVWSMDPRNARSPRQKKVLTADVEIARELLLKYGLRWMPPRHRSKIALSFEESLAHYQSYNSNYSYTFAPATHATLEDQPILTLRGGGGEILRGTGGARILSHRYAQYLYDGGRLAQADWVSRHYLQDSILTEETRRIAQESLTATMAEYPNTSMRERLDAHYRSTRNRAHFGHMRQSESTNDRLLQVLTNPFLQRASEIASYGSKIKSQVVADLFDLIDPSLRTVPFETDAANEQLLRESNPGFRFQDRHRWQDEFDTLTKGSPAINYRPLHAPGDRGEMTGLDPSESARTYIQDGLQKILESVSAQDRKILEPLHQLISENVSTNQLPVGSLVAKLASALELEQPLGLSVPGLHLYTDGSRSDRIQPNNVLAHIASPLI